MAGKTAKQTTVDANIGLLLNASTIAAIVMLMTPASSPLLKVLSCIATAAQHRQASTLDDC